MQPLGDAAKCDSNTPASSANRVPGVRERVLSVAAEMFGDQGYFAVSMRGLAERVGVTKASLFHHFPSKADLYDAMVLDALKGVEQRLRSAEFAARAHWIDDFVDAIVDRPATSRVLLRALLELDLVPRNEESAYAEIRAALDRVLDLVRARLAETTDANREELLQTLIGCTVFHFASKGLGGLLTNSDIFDPASVQRRKEFLKDLIGAPQSAVRRIDSPVQSSDGFESPHRRGSSEHDAPLANDASSAPESA